MYSKAKIAVFENKPSDFAARVEVAACYLEVGTRLLLLQRSSQKPEQGFWGVPGGKIEQGEPIEKAARRELQEETGILLAEDRLRYLKPLYMRKPEVSYVFHMFEVKLEQIPSICLSDEHQDYRWVYLHELEILPLMAGAKEAFYHYQKGRLI